MKDVLIASFYRFFKFYFCSFVCGDFSIIIFFALRMEKKTRNVIKSLNTQYAEV